MLAVAGTRRCIACLPPPRLCQPRSQPKRMHACTGTHTLIGGPITNARTPRWCVVLTVCVRPRLARAAADGYAKGEVVLDKCYDNLVGVRVENTNGDAWTGSVLFSRGPTKVFEAGECRTCTTNGGTAVISVDGDPGNSQAETTCFGGRQCAISPPWIPGWLPCKHSVVGPMRALLRVVADGPCTARPRGLAADGLPAARGLSPTLMQTARSVQSGANEQARQHAPHTCCDASMHPRGFPPLARPALCFRCVCVPLTVARPANMHGHLACAEPRTCCSGIYEAHTGVNHGDVCRGGSWPDTNDAWGCPSGCVSVAGNVPPHCVVTGTDALCRQHPGTQVHACMWPLPTPAHVGERVHACMHAWLWLRPRLRLLPQCMHAWPWPWPRLLPQCMHATVCFLTMHTGALAGAGANTLSSGGTDMVPTSCTASSEYEKMPEYACTKAFDGDASTAWATSGEGVGAWIQLQFPGARSLAAMHYTQSEHERNEKVELEFSGSTCGCCGRSRSARARSLARLAGGARGLPGARAIAPGLRSWVGVGALSREQFVSRASALAP